MTAAALSAPAEWAVALAIGLGAVGSFITSLAQLRQGKQTKAKVDVVASKADEVHELVNDQSTKQVERIEQLATTLQAAGEPVPPAPGKQES